MNPLLPIAYDYVWIAITVAVLVFTVVAAVSIYRARHVGAGTRLLWLAIAVLLPVVGPTLWFSTASPRYRRLRIPASDA